MAIHTEDMSSVAKQGDLIPEGWFRARISSVEEKSSANSGNPVAEFTFKIQDEGEAFGRTIRSWPSLQPHALGHLKAIYEAAGYTPGPEGHDPESTVDMELYIRVVHEVYKGEPSSKIANGGYRSLQQGPRN